jgi:hypothetical protein
MPLRHLRRVTQALLRERCSPRRLETSPSRRRAA